MITVSLLVSIGLLTLRGGRRGGEGGGEAMRSRPFGLLPRSGPDCLHVLGACCLGEDEGLEGIRLAPVCGVLCVVILWLLLVTMVVIVWSRLLVRLLFSNDLMMALAPLSLSLSLSLSLGHHTHRH